MWLCCLCWQRTLIDNGLITLFFLRRPVFCTKNEQQQQQQQQPVECPSFSYFVRSLNSTLFSLFFLPLLHSSSSSSSSYFLIRFLALKALKIGPKVKVGERESLFFSRFATQLKQHNFRRRRRPQLLLRRRRRAIFFFLLSQKAAFNLMKRC